MDIVAYGKINCKETFSLMMPLCIYFDFFEL